MVGLSPLWLAGPSQQQMQGNESIPLPEEDRYSSRVGQVPYDIHT